MKIPGFQLLDEIGRGAYSVVYRASREGQTYAVKLQRPELDDASGAAALRFRREAAILACLRDPGLPAILELGEVEGRPFIVQEYVGGQTLSQLLAKGPLPEDRIVAIARRLVAALAEVHRRGMVHRDVKPDNILIDETDSARLIDFGFAVRASGERVRKEVVGTLLYSAPEQSGMLKRPLDGRSDFYALGVVLFECATGTLPFESKDAGELVRHHAVTEVPDVRERNPEVSLALAEIIRKLLSKDPDDRYQSEGGLIGDLEQLDQLNSHLSRGRSVLLGSLDDPTRSTTDGRLIGRDAELNQLLRQWERAVRGLGGLVLVEGEVGLGKSRLVRELVRRVHTSVELLMLCRCARANPLSFAPLREALEENLARLRLFPSHVRQAMERKVRVAAGGAAALLTRFTPALADALRVTDEMPGIEEVREQFYDALAQFLLRYAKECRRGLIVIEDVESLDDGTRQVLTRMAGHLRDAPLLVVATANAHADNEPVREQFVSEMGSALSSRVMLGPLGDQAIGQLVSAQLGNADGERIDVVQRVAARSNGSPFAATEYVRSMLDTGLLRPSWGKWILDEKGLEDLDLPTDVVDLVVRRVQLLTDDTKAILRAAAVIGLRFSLEHLAEICEVGEEEVHTAATEGIRGRVLEQGAGGTCAFIHVEIREALLADLEPEALRAMHQRIAEVLDRYTEEDEDHTYAVARHYALGEVDKNPQRLFESNVAAGRRALTEYAHEESYTFLQEAERRALARDLELPGDVREALGEVCARTGRLAEAIQYFEQAIAAAGKPVRRAKLRARLAYSHVANFETGPAWQEVQAGFKELGRPFSRWWPLSLLSTLWSFLRGWVADRLGIGFGTARSNRRDRREHDETFVRLCEHGAIAAFLDSRPLRLFQMVLLPYRPATRLGRSAELVTSYYQQAVVHAVAGLTRSARRLIDKAIRLARNLGDRLTLARCHLYSGLVSHLCGTPLEAEAITRRALEEHGQWLDSLHYVDASGDLVFNLLLRGYFREAWVWIERMLPRSRFTVEGVRAIQANPWAGPVLAALGRTTEGLRYQDQMREVCEGVPRTERYKLGELFSYRILFHLEQGEHGEVIDEAIEQYRELGLHPWTTSFHFRGFFLFQAYGRMEQAMRADASDRSTHLDRLASAIRDLKRAAMVPSMRAHAVVIEATLQRLQGRRRRTLKLLDRADRHARDVDSPWVLFEVARQRGHLLREQGKHVPAVREARIALGLALEHGWIYRARRIRNEFDVGDTSRKALDGGSSLTSRPTSSTESLKLQRQLDALLQVSLAAARVLDPGQQAQNALDEVIRILGAERGFLFLCQEEDQPLEFRGGRDADGHHLDQPTGFSTTVVETVHSRREPMVVSGTEQGAVIGSESLVTHDLRSVVAAPLVVHDRGIGVLYLDNRLARGVFTEEDVEILLAIGNHIAVALETSRTAQLEIRYEAEAQKRQLAESLRDMSHALSSTLDLEEVLQRLLDGVTQVVPCNRASVFLLEGENLSLTVERRFEGPRERADLHITVSADPLMSEVVNERKPVVVPDTRRDERIKGKRWEAYLISWIGVPLISHDRVAGALTLESLRDTYSAHEADIAATFAGQAGIAIENARLFGEVQRLAVTDGLTGTLNRRHFFEVAEREFSSAQRAGKRLCAMMIDVDHFKLVNDTYGHAVGDQVLHAIARRCQRSIRDLDILGRYGGEEFVILLPDTSLAVARNKIAERLRKSIADTPLPTNRGELKVTVSIGVALLDDATPDLATLLDRADQALYLAKQRGRNRVEQAAER